MKQLSTGHRVNHQARAVTAVQVSALLLLIGLIAGRFDLSRVSLALDGVDVRWFFSLLAVLAIGPLTNAVPTGKARSLRIFSVALGTWFLWILISTAWAPAGARVGDYALDILFLAVFLFCSAVTLRRFEPHDWRLIWIALLLVAALYLLAALVAGPGEQGRYSAFGGGPNVFVRIMGLGALAALALYLSSRRFLVLCLVPAFAFGAVLSGSRGGLVSAACIALVALPAVIRRLGPMRTFGVIAMLSAASSILVIFLGDLAIALFNERVVQLTFVERYSSGRDQIVNAALELFRQQPVRGAGIDGYYGYVGQYAGLEYPHNLFLAAAAEGGMVGLGLLVLALVAVAVGLARALPLSVDALVLALASTFMLMSSMFSGDYYDSRFIWFFAVAALTAASNTSPGAVEHFRKN